MKKLKNGCHFFNINHMEKFPITDPPKSLGLQFSECRWNGISASAIMKKLKNGCHFFNIDCTEKFPITDPPKEKKIVSTEMEYQQILEMQVFFFLNFPLVHFSQSPILGCISTFMGGYT